MLAEPLPDSVSCEKLLNLGPKNTHRRALEQVTRENPSTASSRGFQ